MPLLPDTFPVLSTNRLNLVELNNDHQQDLFNLMTEPQVTKFYPVISLKQPSDLQPVIGKFAKQFTEKQGIRWGIQLKDSNHLIGTIGFQTLAPGHRGSLLFALSPTHWNQGLTSEAVKEVIDYGFSQLNLIRIEAEVLPGNYISEKLLRNAGFRQEGLLQKWLYWNEQYHDVNMYALVQ